MTDLDLIADTAHTIASGHTDPTRLPQWVYDQWPPQVWPYATAAYLAGIEVGGGNITVLHPEPGQRLVFAFREHLNTDKAIDRWRRLQASIGGQVIAVIVDGVEIHVEEPTINEETE